MSYGKTDRQTEVKALPPQLLATWVIKWINCIL